MNQWGLTDLTGMNVTGTQVLPHYSRLLNRYDRLEERCREYERENRCQVVRLDDVDSITKEGKAGGYPLCQIGRAHV